MNFDFKFSGSDIVVILASLLSLISLIVSIILNHNFESKWNKKKIDANLIGKAKIEWIQSVRKITSDLIMNCYLFIAMHGDEVINDEDVVLDIKKTKNKIDELIELLKFYFGPDELNINTTLENRDSNEGKNNLIINLLNNFSNDLDSYFRANPNLEIKKLNHDNAEREQYIDNECSVKILTGYTEDGDEEYNTILSYDSEKQDDYKYNIAEIEKNDKRIINLKCFINKFKEKIKTIENVIRIYLKIEWENIKGASNK